MKRLKLILAVCIASLSLCFIGPKPNVASTDAASIAKPSIVEWDTENKLIFANLNSLLIVAENGGTTVYLDLPEGGAVAEEYQTGDGVLGANDLSLADLYAADPSKYTAQAPEDGADLSAWSIVIGGNNIDGNMSSSKKTVITMTGGEIYNIYNGCSTLQAESVSTIAGEEIAVTITGGNVNAIHTDFGYVAQFGGAANGSNKITFNLLGGTIQSVCRGQGNKLVYGSKINFGGSIKVVQGIEMAKYVKGSMIYLTSALDDAAMITFDVGDHDGKSFSKSNELFTVGAQDVALLEALDLNQITLSNVEEEFADWVVYKNQNTVKFGYDVKVDTVEITGIFKVGETLRLNFAPATATFKSITWYTINPSTEEMTTLSSGLTCSLSAQDGGDYIYVRAVDQNDATNIFELRSNSAVQRVELPEIVLQDTNVFLYANGNDLLIVGGEKGTTVYIDLGTIGEKDSRDISLKESGIKSAYNDDADLSKLTICTGCSNGETTGNVNITMLSGHIKEIISKSKDGKTIDGYVNINLKGGIVDVVSPKSTAVNGEVLVNISANAVAKIYSKFSSLGGAEIRIVGALTDKSAITIIEDKPILNGNICIEADDEQFIDISKFKFEAPDGSTISGLKLKKGFLDDRHTIDYDVKKVDSIRLVGKVRVGSTLKVETNPSNAYLSVKWYRSDNDSFDFAEVISGVYDVSYTLTAEDEGKYIFVMAVDGYNHSHVFEASTDKAVAPEKLPSGIVAVLVIAIVVAVLIVAFVVWFILWKKLIVGGWFMTKVFERIDKAFFKTKEEPKAEDASEKKDSKTEKTNKKESAKVQEKPKKGTKK